MLVCRGRWLKVERRLQLGSEQLLRQSSTLLFAACDSATLKSSCADWGRNSRARRERQQLGSCRWGKVSRHLQLLE